MKFQKMMKNIISIKTAILLILPLVVLVLSCSEDEEVYPRTRLFKPVLQDQLFSIDNTIVVDISKSKEALNYELEVSRDTFKTIEYRFSMDTTYAVINEGLVGEELLWNTIYQVRAKAFADESEYNSRVSDLGNIRTQKFPTTLLAPNPENDVIDAIAKVTWARNEAKPVTQLRVFAADDARLRRPLIAVPVLSEEDVIGTKFLSGLSPQTTYQIAIYYGEELGGWERYTTLVALVNKEGANVIDLTDNTDPASLPIAYLAANDGDTIVLKKGRTYDLPQSGEEDADHSITIIGDLGFESSKAKLYTSGNWNIVPGSNIDHIRFVNVEIEGEDMGGDYVFNPNITGETHVTNLTFDDCIIHNVRGILRMRSDMFVENYTIKNSIVHHIGNYGLLTCDTDGEGKAAVSNLVFENSTFSHVTIGIQTRQNMQSVLFEGCTFNNFPERGRQIFRFRGSDGFDEAINGVTISNSIFGHSWDPGETGDYAINAVDGLTESNITVLNVYATTNFAMSEGNEITGVPSSTYGGSSEDLWDDPENLDYNFKDGGFNGRTDSGDPRWRTEL
jgi:hypothetical protein